MENPDQRQAQAPNNDTNPHFLPNFGIRQWLLLILLCATGLWLAINRNTPNQPELESVSMASAKADYYLESFTLMSTKSNGDTDYTLSAETLIHVPTEERARVSSPSLTVRSNNAKSGDWELNADSGLLPDDGQTITLEGQVQLLQQSDDNTPVHLTTPKLLLNRREMLLSSNSGVSVQGPGWQLQADKMVGEVESGKLTFRENSHVQYIAAPPAN